MECPTTQISQLGRLRGSTSCFARYVAFSGGSCFSKPRSISYVPAGPIGDARRHDRRVEDSAAIDDVPPRDSRGFEDELRARRLEPHALTAGDGAFVFCIEHRHVGVEGGDELVVRNHARRRIEARSGDGGGRHGPAIKHANSATPTTRGNHAAPHHCAPRIWLRAGIRMPMAGVMPPATS